MQSHLVPTRGIAGDMGSSLVFETGTGRPRSLLSGIAYRPSLWLHTGLDRPGSESELDHLTAVERGAASSTRSTRIGSACTAGQMPFSRCTQNRRGL
jgi:hypothetical protein